MARPAMTLLKQSLRRHLSTAFRTGDAAVGAGVHPVSAPADPADTPLARRREDVAALRRRGTFPYRQPEISSTAPGQQAAHPNRQREDTTAALRRRVTHPDRRLGAESAAAAVPAAAATVLSSTASSTPAGTAVKDDAAWRRQLTRAEYAVLCLKRTERPHTGAYDNLFPPTGHFACAACGSALYSAASKFQAGCGWPAFESCIEGAVMMVPDGHRTEIVCRACEGHLGHVFRGERLTASNLRHCVNSVALKYHRGKTPAAAEGQPRGH